MKTTLDLPNPLVEEVQRRASRDGRELGETFVGLLEKGLEVTNPNPSRLEPAVVTTSVLGFPLIAGGHPARPFEKWTAERVAELLVDQEAAWHHEAARH